MAKLLHYLGENLNGAQRGARVNLKRWIFGMNIDRIKKACPRDIKQLKMPYAK